MISTHEREMAIDLVLWQFIAVDPLVSMDGHTDRSELVRDMSHSLGAAIQIDNVYFHKNIPWRGFGEAA